MDGRRRQANQSGKGNTYQVLCVHGVIDKSISEMGPEILASRSGACYDAKRACISDFLLWAKMLRTTRSVSWSAPTASTNEAFSIVTLTTHATSPSVRGDG